MSHPGRRPASKRLTVQITRDENLGTRLPMILRLAKRTELARRLELRNWLGDPAKTRQKREELLLHCCYKPQPVPLSPKLLRTVRMKHFVRYYYRIRISADDYTEAVLNLPYEATASRPVPGLLAIHEGGGAFLWGKDKVIASPDAPHLLRTMQRQIYNGTPSADFFASSGFAVLSFDQIGFGSRALWRDEDERERATYPSALTPAVEKRIRLRMRYEQFWLHRALLSQGVTESEITLHDNRRALDFLASLSQVDRHRLGAYGHSVGAHQCHQLAALDTRIKASVRVCWSADIASMLKRNGPRVLGVHFLMPGLHAHAQVPELVALSDPGAVLIINAKQDIMYSLEAQEKVRRQVRKIAIAQGRTDRVRWEYFEGGHSFPPAQLGRALQFFNRWLLSAQ